jgi:hypothetical protein
MDDKECCSEHSGMCRSIKAEQEKADIRFQMIEGNIKIAKDEMDRRLEGMNEFRAQLDKQAQTFMPRSEIELLINTNAERTRSIEIEMGKIGGSSRWSDHIVQVLIGAAMVIAVWLITKG